MISDGPTMYIPGFGTVPSPVVTPDNTEMKYDEETPSASDLAYEDEHEDKVSGLPQMQDLGYGELQEEEPPIPFHYNRSGQSAVQIRNGKRIRPLLGPYSSCSGSICSMDSSYYSTDDYDSDDESCVESQQNQGEDQDLTELTVDLGEHANNEAGGFRPAQVNMEFKGNAAAPKRISLSFNQQTNGRSTTRTGCLDVSIGTSRLPRRRATMNQSDEANEIIRGYYSNLTVSTRPMQRVSIDHSKPSLPTAISSSRCNRPTRRITMNLCSRRSSRRGSGVCRSDLPRRAPSKTRSYGGQMSPLRKRPTTEYSKPTVALSELATRRTTMDMSSTSATGEQRRISMNLTKSVLPRATPTVAADVIGTPAPKLKPARSIHAMSA